MEMMRLLDLTKDASDFPSIIVLYLNLKLSELTYLSQKWVTDLCKTNIPSLALKKQNSLAKIIYANK